MPNETRHIFRIILRKLLLRDRSLMTKFTVYSTLLVVVPMLLAGTISYRESSQTLETEARQYSWLIIEQVKQNVEDYLRGFEIDTLQIVNHPDTVVYLKLRSLEEVNDAEIVPKVRNVLRNSAYSQSDVLNITLLLDHIHTINSAMQPGVSSVTGLENEYWYGSIPVTGRPKVYSRVIEWNGRTEPVVSVIKRIANPNTLEAFGTLVIDLNYKRLHEVARKVRLGKNGHGYLFILDEQGYYVYHPNTSVIGKKAAQPLIRSIGEQPSGSFIAEANGRKSLYTFSRSESLGWQVATSIPYDELMSSRENIGRMIFGTTALFTAFALVFSVGLAASIVKPIKRMYQYMRKVEVWDFKGKLPVETSDEIGMLSKGFNTMVERLSQLLDEVYVSKLKQTELSLRQKETELKMLQAQINPHFLYNALETIRGMALDRDVDEIGSMAAALARLLRYNIKESSATVTVRQEIEIAEMYLRIQQFRFEERLQYRIDVPEWALEQRIAKFTLQPILENSIVHGMETTLGTTLIRVTAARLEDGAFAIAVADNGPGIPPGKLLTLLEQDEEEHAAGETRIGVLNVHRRIRHVFGDEFGLRYRSREGEGTEVSIVLPYDLHKEA